jgi:hypothetical protein
VRIDVTRVWASCWWFWIQLNWKAHDPAFLSQGERQLAMCATPNRAVSGQKAMS